MRQGVYDRDAPAGLPEARERGLTQRWEQVGVVPVFVDHYTDVAQVLAEIARRRAAYLELPVRAAAWLAAVSDRLLATHDPDAFVRSQRIVSALLRDALSAAVATAEQLTGEHWDETLALRCDSPMPTEPR